MSLFGRFRDWETKVESRPFDRSFVMLRINSGTSQYSFLSPARECRATTESYLHLLCDKWEYKIQRLLGGDEGKKAALTLRGLSSTIQRTH